MWRAPQGAWEGRCTARHGRMCRSSGVELSVQLRLPSGLAPQTRALVAVDDAIVQLETVPLCILHAMSQERELGRLAEDQAGGAKLAPFPLNRPCLKKFPLSHDVAHHSALT